VRRLVRRPVVLTEASHVTITTPDEIARSAAPLVAETDVPVCDVCGGTELDDHASGFDYEMITCRNQWRFVRCRACGHVWLHPRPSIEALDTIYPPTYYAYNYESQISPLARRGKEMLDGLKMRKILAACDGLPTRYLDVGCGDGRYLEALARRGVARDGLFGLELDEAIVEKVRARGLQAYCERVETTERFDDGMFDLITMFHVIEHIDSPRAVVERLASWLRPGGVLALETPNIDSLDARLFRSGRWGGYHIPRHWHLFNPDTFRRLVESFGLEVLTIRYETGHSFWMYSLHHALRYRRKPMRRLARFFDPLESLLPLVAFTGFDKARSAVGAKTSAMLLLARRPDDGQPAR
jgi:2-polyprenyl-3-methyl-5-hydroxy-6-metoxy-1,4-benzoquinol methylase